MDEQNRWPLKEPLTYLFFILFFLNKRKIISKKFANGNEGKHPEHSMFVLLLTNKLFDMHYQIKLKILTILHILYDVFILQQ